MDEQNNLTEEQIDRVDENHQRVPNFQEGQMIIIDGQFFRVKRVKNYEMRIKTLSDQEVQKVKQDEIAKLRGQSK